MECKHCGWLLPEGASFCPGCGHSCDPADKPVPGIPAASPETPADHTAVAPSEPESDAPIASEETSLCQEESSAPLPEPEIAPAEELPVEEDDEDWEEYAKLTPHRSHPLLMPALILVALFVVGTVCYFLFPFGSKDPTPATTPGVREPNHPTLPRQQEDEASAVPETHGYEPTDEHCFLVEDGAVRFLPGRHDGSPILVIPETVGGQTVTAIAPQGFAGMEGITTLVLPETIRSIGDSAFSGCGDLRGVRIPSSVNAIGASAFRDCISMESVYISSAVSTIGSDAFDGCASLMYLFYEGTYEQWLALYNEYITPFTYACCSDGDYYHGVYMP